MHLSTWHETEQCEVTQNAIILSHKDESITNKWTVMITTVDICWQQNS